MLSQIDLSLNLRADLRSNNCLHLFVSNFRYHLLSVLGSDKQELKLSSHKLSKVKKVHIDFLLADQINLGFWSLVLVVFNEFRKLNFL